MSFISHDPLIDRLRIRRFRQSKRIRLRIDETGILLTAPLRTKDEEAMTFFFHHRDWVEHQLSRMDQKMSVYLVKERQNQRFFLTEGQWLPIEEVDADVDWVHIEQQPSKIVIRYPRLLRNRGELWPRLKEWCKEQTLKKAEGLIAEHKDKLVRLPSKLRISSAKSKWGSCTSKGVVSLHYRLHQLAPLALQYVVFHELAHLVHLNHSQKFWSEVVRLMPNYKDGNAKLLQRDFPFDPKRTL